MRTLFTIMFAVHALVAPAQATPASAPAEHAPTTRPAAPSGTRLHILFTTDLFGRFAWPACEGAPPADRAELAHLVSATRELRRRIRAAGDGEPLVLHAGSMLRFDVLGAHAFAPQSPHLARTADLLAAVGFDAASIGLHDFGAAPLTLRRYMTAMRRRGLPLLAGNVACHERDDFRCRLRGDARQPYLLFERNGLRIGVFSVIREDLRARVLGSAAGSVHVTPAEKLVRARVQALRRLPVDLVVLLAEVNVEGQAPQPVLDLVRRLGADTPDVIVAGNMFEPRSEDFLLQIRRGAGPTIVGTDRFGQHLGELIVHFDADASRRRVRRIEVRRHRVATFAPAPEAVQPLRSLMDRLCRDRGNNLGAATFRTPMSRQQFITYVMHVMRRRTGAEVALLNDSSVADTGFPLAGPLTELKLLRAIRTETALGSVRIPGAQLAALLAPHLGNGSSELHQLGVERRADAWFVNGRPLIEGHRYRVAVTRFVARGGDGLVALQDAPFVRDTRLRSALRDFFRDGEQARADDDPDIALARDFPELIDRWLLFTGTSLGLYLSTVSVANGPEGDRFSRPLLVRDNVTDLSAELKLYLGASTRDHVVESDALLQYGRAWTRKQTEAELSVGDSKDLVQARGLYKLQLLRNRYGAGRWFIPDPYGEVALTTEFTPSGKYTDEAGAEQSYHFLELNGSAGAGFTLHPLLLLKVGVTARGELLTPTAAKKGEPSEAGLYLGYTLRRWQLLTTTRYPLELESRLDFRLTDIAADLRRELTVQSTVVFKLNSWLALSVDHRLFVLGDRPAGTSAANDLRVGLNLLWDHRHQTF